MPEAPEVEKLRLQLEPAWKGRTVERFSAPVNSPNPRKYFQGEWWKFLNVITKPKILMIDRIGKNLIVILDAQYMWHIHLNSTGWWMPGNLRAAEATKVDQIVNNFLHKVNDGNVRVKMHLNDGQTWHYHDSRTWGKWWLRDGKVPYEDDYFLSYGPDWISNPAQAYTAILQEKTTRTVKDVLCDRKVAAGIGNYLACEIAHHANVHPHRRWHTLTVDEKTKLAIAIQHWISMCMTTVDHEHWQVFDRAGKPCYKHPNSVIEYAKDSKTKAARGSYFCTECQGMATL